MSKLKLRFLLPITSTVMLLPQFASGVNVTAAGLQSAINKNPFCYSGYYHDPETGFFYLKARYYSPMYGVFTSLDTYDLPDRYAYCDGNPVMYSDPGGHMLRGQIASVSGKVAVEVQDIGAASILSDIRPSKRVRIASQGPSIGEAPVVVPVPAAAPAAALRIRPAAPARTAASAQAVEPSLSVQIARLYVKVRNKTLNWKSFVDKDIADIETARTSGCIAIFDAYLNFSIPHLEFFRETANKEITFINEVLVAPKRAWLSQTLTKELENRRLELEYAVMETNSRIYSFESRVAEIRRQLGFER